MLIHSKILVCSGAILKRVFFSRSYQVGRILSANACHSSGCLKKNRFSHAHSFKNSCMQWCYPEEGVFFPFVSSGSDFVRKRLSFIRMFKEKSFFSCSFIQKFLYAVVLS